MSLERSKRSNRGNNLFKLINEEKELLNQDVSISRNPEDELLDAVFQEREDDADMEVEENSDASDDAFSGSESSSEDEDDSDSDAETKLDQSKRKKRLLKKNNQIPVLIKRNTKKTSAGKRKRTDSDLNIKDFLDSESRRQSSRSATRSNRLKTYENLKNEEIVRKQRNHGKTEKIVEAPLTQEERLANAEETEKINTASLQRFREIEIFEKKLIEEQQKKYKVKFKDEERVLRFSSEVIFLSPDDYEEVKKQELEDETRQMSKSLKKKYLEQKKQEYEKLKESLNYVQSNNEELEKEEFEESVHEGPHNKIKRNMFTLYNFNSYQTPTSKELSETFNFNIVPKEQIKMERWIHLKSKENEGTGESLIKTGKFLFTKSEIQQTMANFRKFGEYGNFSKATNVETDENTENDQKLHLKYSLEPSLFYKNVADSNTTNIKKNCYIKYNEKVKYIDPKLNISYSDLDVFKRLTNLVNHDASIKWVSLSEASGAYAATDTTPAKGVPEGF